MTNREFLKLYIQMQSFQEPGNAIGILNKKGIETFLKRNEYPIAQLEHNKLVIQKKFLQFKDGKPEIKMQGNNPTPVFLEGRTDVEFKVAYNEFMDIEAKGVVV